MRPRFTNHAPRHSAQLATITALMITALNLNARRLYEVATPCDMTIE